MSTVNGLPIHALLVHFIVVLAPLTAGLAILCAVWPAARQRLVWLVLALAAATMALTPLTTDSGEWLEHNIEESELVEKHAEMGDTMIYFALALLVAAVLLAVMHLRAVRGKALSAVLSAVIAVFVVVASGATAFQVYRIGHSGATSVWSDALNPATAGAAAEDGE
jgi:ABC-type branched-subunit amino acid transport system permease subunit